MRLMKVWLFAIALAMSSSLASAQSTTGTISGRITDPQDLPVPGVTVSAESPNLQGIRSAVTSENGDYILTLLPSGAYVVTFELSGFQRLQRTVNLAPTQTVPLNAAMGPAAVSETVQVVGRSADVLTQTAQVATNFSQELIESLPTNRGIDASILMAPAVHPTGPGGAYTIAGSTSFENLFMVNGVAVTENIRGQPYDLYIEDAIQETTVATAGISAEYGRFGGGVVNVITKSGGNAFAGSFRDSLANDNWRAKTAFAADVKSDKTVPTYEYTFGGPVVRDRLWFFTAGRLQELVTGRTLVATEIPYDFTNKSGRYEFKGTYSLDTAHRFQGSYTKISQQLTNNTFNQALSMDLNSLEDREEPQELFTLSYNGILTPNFAVEGRYSFREFQFVGSGSKLNDRIGGTLLLDRSRSNQRYWSATFCGVCGPESRNNDDIYVKASYFLSTGDYGSHNVGFGYDRFNDKRTANNHQSGSDYRFLGTAALIRGTEIWPVFLGDGTTIIQWNPILLESQGTNFVTNSLFVNDNWRVTDRVTANIGLRYDGNQGRNSIDQLVTDDSAISPRIGIVWDPTGEAKWAFSANYAKYVAAISGSIANASSPGGNPDTLQFIYRGPDINGGNPASPVSTAAAIQQVFTWYDAFGGSNLPLNGTPTVTGVTPQILESLVSPNVNEYAAGVSRQFGARAAVRVDFSYRNYADFYINRTDMNTGKVSDRFGRTYDLTVIENDPGDLKRRYTGVSLQSTYRFNSTVDVGANWTISRAWGNVDGETAGSGPTRSDYLQYPEYKQVDWNRPEGDLAIDQRHRARLWITYGLPWVKGMTLSALQILETGVPYGAVSTSGVNAQPYVTNPGYTTTPPGNATTYYYSARDAYRTEGQKRMDFAANYSFRVPTLARLQLFGQLQVINLWNQSQLCGCGGTVFSNAGGVISERIDQTVRTNVTAAATYAAFNPFTTTPVEGVNWAKGPVFGTALNRFAYTSPRAIKVGFGVRF
jgi:hypothetical protein